MFDRRAVLTVMPFAIAGCMEDAGTGTQTSEATNAATAVPSGTQGVPSVPGNRVLSPQIAFGSPTAPAFTEVAVSLHCGATRAFTATTLRNRLAAARAGQRVVVVTHYVRTENEIPLGVSLLQTGDRYPEALMALLGLSARLNRALSAAEANQFLIGAGFARDPRIAEADARLALGLARVTYDSAGVTQTPFIREG